MTEQTDNLYDRYGENAFSLLAWPPPVAPEDDAGGAAEREVAERHGLPYLDEDPLHLDEPSVSRVGPAELARLRAMPVRCADGSLRVVMAEATSERLAAIQEHFPTEVALGLVTATTIDRLLEAAETSSAAPGDAAVDAGVLGQNFERVLGLFDEEAGRFQALRQKLQQLGRQMSEREHHLHQLEGELAVIRVDRQRDQETIEQLRQELSERNARLEHVAIKARELGAIIHGDVRP